MTPVVQHFEFFLTESRAQYRQNVLKMARLRTRIAKHVAFLKMEMIKATIKATIRATIKATIKSPENLVSSIVTAP